MTKEKDYCLDCGAEIAEDDYHCCEIVYLYDEEIEVEK